MSLEKVRKKKATVRLQGAELEAPLAVMGKRGRAAVAELEQARDEIQAMVRSRAGQTLRQRAGLAHETLVKGTFNSAARKAGDFLTTAQTGHGNGFATDPRVDIKVTRGSRVIAEAQAKCCSSARRTAVELSKQRYRGTQRIPPKDQAEKVRELLTESAKRKALSTNPRMRQIGANRAETAEKVSSTLKAGGHKSRGVTRKEALQAAKGKTPKLNQQIAKEAFTSEALNGLAAGAALGGGISAIRNVRRAAKGQISAKAAAKQVMVDTAVNGTRSMATAVAAEGVRQGAKHLLKGAAKQALSKGCGPMAVAGFAVDTIEDACRGELSLGKTARNATRAAGSFAGFKGGAAIGTAIFPGIGTVIGAAIGSLGGSILAGLF